MLLGRRGYSVKRGASAIVNVALTDPGFMLLLQQKKLRARITLTSKTGGAITPQPFTALVWLLAPRSVTR
jgi:hypothetical protein